MLFEAPSLDDRELQVLELIDGTKKDLQLHLHDPSRWYGSVARSLRAKAVRGSNSIEGFDAAQDDVAAIDLGEEPLDADEETKLAIKGYRDAMTFVLQLAKQETFLYSEILLKSLHFMMTSHDLSLRPGQWRAGPIYVHDEETDEIVYTGPDLELVPPLVGELIDTLSGEDGQTPVVRAAIAHLNLVMIHPFRDGNGRMARCLQTFVLSRDKIVHPVFSSVEEYLGHNTRDYYAVLAAVGAGGWHPDRDARPWVRFMLAAHLHQGRTVLRRMKEAGILWEKLEKLLKRYGLDERMIPLVWDAAMGYRVRRATYLAAAEQNGEELTEAMASRDLRQLSETGLLLPKGEKRGRHYTRGTELRTIWDEIRASRPARDTSDPFAL